MQGETMEHKRTEVSIVSPPQGRIKGRRSIPCAQLRVHHAQIVIFKCSPMRSKVQRTYPDQPSSPDAETDYCFCYSEIALAFRHRSLVWKILPAHPQLRTSGGKI